MPAAAVTNVAVTCGAVPTYTIGGTVSGLGTGKSVVLQNNGGGNLTLSANAPFTFATALTSGSAYAVTVLTQPVGQACTVASGTGTVAAANVTNVAVSCIDVVLQRWEAPTAWGGLWQPSATLVQHAVFNATTIVEDAATGITWTLENGSEPAKKEFRGFPGVTRTGAGPFTGQRYQAAVAPAFTERDMIACVVFKPDHDPQVGQEKPIFARGLTAADAHTANGGWSLTQMSVEPDAAKTRAPVGQFRFQYTYNTVGGGQATTAAWVPTLFARKTTGTDGVPGSVTVVPEAGPLNASLVVLCGGRADNRIYAVANGVAAEYGQTPLRADEAVVGPAGAPQTVLAPGTHPLTIGGYDTGDATKAFGGRVYETAIWNEPGTPANIQAKLAQIQGLLTPSGAARYVRNREAPFYGADAVAGTPAAGYHTAWHHGPRFDASAEKKGLLFGLQNWNRVNHYATIAVPSEPTDVYVLSEDPGIVPIAGVVPTADPLAPGPTPGWAYEGGASVAASGDVEPPGDSENQSSRLVTLPAGGRLKRDSRPFESIGSLHGQIWIRVPGPTTGTLRIRAGSFAVPNQFDIDLGALPANTWTRHSLYRSPGGQGNEIRADAAGATTLYVENTSGGPMSFYLWGLQLTQVGTAPAVAGGSPVNADLGAEMYDWSAIVGPGSSGSPAVLVDALQLPAVTTSTTASGFCLSAEAAPANNLPWTAPFTAQRTLLAWVNSPLAPTSTAKLYLSGATNTPQASPQICFALTGGTPLCAAIPSSFAPGLKRTVTACVDPAGQARIYADNVATPIAGPAAAGTVPNLSGGTLLVGGSSVLTSAASEPFHGYVSKALVCRDGTGLVGCQ
jgi:hypothetical protein